MKRINSILILLFFCISSYATGPINLGIKIGANSSSLITDYNEYFNKSQVNHYLVGAFGRVNLGRIYLQPEIYFNTKGGIINASNSSAIIPDFSEVFSYQTIDIPVLLGLNIINKSIFNLRIHAGPVLQYVTTKPIISDVKNLDIGEFKDNYMGIQAGVGVDLWFLTIDARVENNFNIFIKNSNFSATNRVFIVSAGVKLF